jgi:uncharacterized Zn finger protein
MTPEEPPEDRDLPPRTGSAVHAALLRCDACGEETPHRILHVAASSARAGSEAMRGVARCRTCGLSHPFVSELPRSDDVWLILSDGPRSSRSRLTLPSDRRLQVGSGVPGSSEPVVIHKIEGRDGGTVPTARVREIATVWAVRDTGPMVPYSLVEGRVTRSGLLSISPDALLEVGARVRLPTTPATIVGLRARDHTWRREGDRFPAREVQRLYARRTVSPPAGRSDWRSERETSSSRASETSMAARSRSSPGASRTRIVPRARRADGGATVQRSSAS